MGGNYALYDIILALKWIQENIANFGGDPDSVTLWGHSAGGWNVGVLTVSPLAKGLFSAAICHSGSLSADAALRSPTLQSMAKTAKFSGCNNVDTMEDIKECYKGKDIDQIVKGVLPLQYPPWPSEMCPIYDMFQAIYPSPLLPANPTVLAQTGSVNVEYFMAGVTDAETAEWGRYSEGESIANCGASLLEAFDAFNCTRHDTLRDALRREYEDGQETAREKNDARIEASVDACVTYSLTRQGKAGMVHGRLRQDNAKKKKPRQSDKPRKAKLMSDIDFNIPGINMADTLSRNNNTVAYFYEVTSTGKVPHGRDLFYVFGGPLASSSGATAKAMSRLMMDSWANFVKYRNPSPNPDTPLPNYEPTNQAYFQFVMKNGRPQISQIRTAHRFKSERRHFWNVHLPKLMSCSGHALSPKILSLTLHIISIVYIIPFPP